MKKMIAAALTVLLLYGLYRFSLPSLTEEQAGFTEKISQEEKEKKDDRTAALQEKGFPQSVAERLIPSIRYMRKWRRIRQKAWLSAVAPIL